MFALSPRSELERARVDLACSAPLRELTVQSAPSVDPPSSDGPGRALRVRKLPGRGGACAPDPVSAWTAEPRGALAQAKVHAVGKASVCSGIEFTHPRARANPPLTACLLTRLALRERNRDTACIAAARPSAPGGGRLWWASPLGAPRRLLPSKTCGQGRDALYPAAGRARPSRTPKLLHGLGQLPRGAAGHDELPSSTRYRRGHGRVRVRELGYSLQMLDFWISVARTEFSHARPPAGAEIGSGGAIVFEVAGQRYPLDEQAATRMAENLRTRPRHSHA
jgi:hypothetical protein